MFPCHPQTKLMASAMIFLEVPEWTQHYDLALDSLVLVAHSSFRLYIFFIYPFSVRIVNWHFDPNVLYADIPWRLGHPQYFSEPTPSASLIETDPFEGSSPHSVLHVAEYGSSSTGTEALPEIQPKEDPGEPVLENQFHTSQAYVYWDRLFSIYIPVDLGLMS